MNPETSSQLKNSEQTHLRCLSVSSNFNKTASPKKTREGIYWKSQVNLSRSNPYPEGTHKFCRRSLRLASQSKMKTFESPLGFPSVSVEKVNEYDKSTIYGNEVVNSQLLRPLAVDAVSVGNVKESIETTNGSNVVDHWEPLEVDCKVQSRRRSMRLASVLNSQFLGCSMRRQPLRPLGLDVVSLGNVKELIETTKESKRGDNCAPLELDCKVLSQRRSMRLALVSAGARKELNKTPEIIAKLSPKITLEKEKDCKPMSCESWVQSCRLAAASNRLMNRGVVTLEVTDEVKVVCEGSNADSVSERNISGCMSMKKRDYHKEKRRKMEKDNGAENNIDKLESGEYCGSVEWTKEQEEALQKAYIRARPSPHFWKKVSRMVPGKSAHECFDKVHANFATPVSSEPRSRRVRKSLSPIGNFSLTGNISSHISEFKGVRIRSSKSKKLAAQKIVRHLLRKHCLADQRNAADHFSLLESSPINIAVNLPDIQTPETSCRTSNSPGLTQQSGEHISANVKLYSRFKLLTPPDRPSPEVLKQLKDRALHDKYIDELHRREARRVMHGKKLNSKVFVNKCDSKIECGTLKAARTALLSDAKSFINYFQHTHANCMHDLDNKNIDDNYDANEDDDAGDINE